MSEHDLSAQDEKMKNAVKEALKEWLDEKFTAFGKWAAVSVAAMALAALVYFILAMHGWKAPQ